MSFDPLARHYRWIEAVLAGNKLQRCRTAFLDPVSASKNVLTVGEGNGRFLQECRRRLPTAKITVVDASDQMLHAARRSVDPTQIQFIHADLLTWQPSERFDLIVTNFFLDCFPPETLDQIIQKLTAAAETGASWLLADFQIPTRGWKRLRAAAIHRLMYLFFRVATRLPARRLTAPAPFLAARGWKLASRITSDWDLLHSDHWRR